MDANRRNFHPLILEEMRKNKNIYFLTADLGYKMLDSIRDEFPDRFFNVGASEQLLLAIGVGLAQDGKIPICYSMPPFLLYRPAEIIRNYLGYENCPVKLLGGGRGKDYTHDGFSHYAGDDSSFLTLFPNIKQFRPNDFEEMKINTKEWLHFNGPDYLNLKR